MERTIDAFTTKAEKVTFPMTACLAEKYPSLFRAGAEFAVHGYRHQDYSKLDTTELEWHLEKSLAIFQKAGYGNIGFRAPYLKVKKDILRSLKTCGFLYDSSSVIHWGWLSAEKQNEQYKRTLEHYAPWDSRDKESLPYHEEELLRLPVSLPDDEMLIDRLGIRDQDKLFEIWSGILHQCNQRNEMFVLLLHPERYFMAEGAIDKLIEEADNTGMWRATLKEIALWWDSPGRSQRWPHKHRGALCITGDIDMVSLLDLFR